MATNYKFEYSSNKTAAKRLEGKSFKTIREAGAALKKNEEVIFNEIYSKGTYSQLMYRVEIINDGKVIQYRKFIGDY